MRVFVALDISQKAKDEIRKIQEQLPKFDGKLTETFSYLADYAKH